MRDESADRRNAVDAGPDRSWVAEQLAATRARQQSEAEPEPEIVLGEALRDLAADWGEVLAAAWNGPHGRDARLAARAGAHAALAAIATWLAAVTLCVTVWLVSSPDTSGIGGPLRAGGQLWLLGHHAALDVPAGRLALAPLGFTALLVFGLWQTAVAPITRPVQIAYTAFGAATGYCLVAALVATGAATTDVRPDTAQAVLFAVLFGALVPTAARWRRIAGFCDLPQWVVTAARAAAAAGAVLVGGGALTLAGTMVVHLPETGWPHGIADALGMFLLSLAVLPNALAWSAAYALGPGFAVGTGTGVSMLSTKVGALPTFPMLRALPHDGSRTYPYDLAFLALPVAAGVVLALVVLRAGARPLGERVRALSAAAVAVALPAGLVAALSGGPLSGGRMATFGPSGWRTAVATLVLLGLSGAIVVLVPAVKGLPRLSAARLVDAAAVLRPRRSRVEAVPEVEAVPAAEPEPEPEPELESEPEPEPEPELEVSVVEDAQEVSGAEPEPAEEQEPEDKPTDQPDQPDQPDQTDQPD